MKQAKLVRVTSVLSFCESAWKEWWWRKTGFEAADEISKESAEFGTLVHKKIEGALKGEIQLDIESKEPSDQCAVTVIMWLEQNGIKPLFDTYEKSLEIEVQDKKLGLIGHVDYAAKVNNAPCIIDFKTSNKMRKSFVLQKAAYAKMASKMFKLDIDNGLTIRCHWNKEKKEVEFETKMYYDLCGKYWKIFSSCLAVWMYFNRSDK